MQLEERVEKDGILITKIIPLQVFSKQKLLQ